MEKASKGHTGSLKLTGRSCRKRPSRKIQDEEKGIYIYHVNLDAGAARGQPKRSAGVMYDAKFNDIRYLLIRLVAILI